MGKSQQKRHLQTFKIWRTLRPSTRPLKTLGHPSSHILQFQDRNNWVIMSMPRQVMQLARKSVQVQPVRGKAVSNWKRPTMDEYLAPHEAYGPANAKRQKSYNMFFVGGVLSFIASLAGGTVLDVWEFNPYPHHLMTNAPGGVRGTPINDEE